VREVEAERLAQLVEPHRPEHVDRAVGAGHDRPPPGRLLDLSHHLLEQVLHGDEAGCAAMLVHDDGHVHSFVLDRRQHLVEARRLGDEGHGPRGLPADRHAGKEVLPIELLDVRRTDDVVEVAVVDGVPRVARLAKDPPELRRLAPERDAIHRDAGDHDLGRGPVGELEQVLQHAARLPGQLAAELAVLEHVLQVPGGVVLARRLLRAVDAEEPQQRPARALDRHDERPEEPTGQAKRQDDEQRRRFRPCQRHGLRHHLAEDHVQARDEGDGEDAGQRVREVEGRPVAHRAGEPPHEPLGELGLGVHAEAERGQGDADLNGRDVAVHGTAVVENRLQPPREALTTRGARVDDGARADDGAELGRHEQRVDADQAADEDEGHEDAAKHGRCPPVPQLHPVQAARAPT
jgi:hypothetical protein